MIVYTPPAAATSGATTALLPYDWAARPHGLDAAEWVQGGTPDLTDWTDVAAVGGWGGTLALASVTRSLGDTAIRLQPTLDPAAVGQPVEGLGAPRGQGIARAVAAGDWVYACRMALHTPTASQIATSALSQFVFVNSNGAAPDVTTHRWYGAGLRYSAQTMETASFAAGSAVGLGNEWNSHTASQITGWWRSTTVDVYLRRSGTNLLMYAAPAGQIPRQVNTRTVGAGAGLIGWRLINDGTTVHVTTVLAFARLSALPGA